MSKENTNDVLKNIDYINVGDVKAEDVSYNLELKEEKEENDNIKDNNNHVILEKPPNMIINLDNIKEKSEPITNTEVLLSIFEITSNSKYYGLNSSNKSRHFWNQLTEIPQFSKVLDVYKSETLRKYWRLISEIGSAEKIIKTIKNHEEAINNTSMKLLTIISVIKDFLSNRIKDLDKHLIEAPDRNIVKGGNSNYIGSKNKKKDLSDDDESFNIEEELNTLNKNTHVNNNVENKKLLNNKRSKIKNTELSMVLLDNKKLVEDELLNEEGNKDETNNVRKSLRPKNISNVLFNINDKAVFSQIEIIVNTFKSFFPELDDRDLWDALKKNSFNIINTYCYLTNPEDYEGKTIIVLFLYYIVLILIIIKDVCFNDEDDYILKNLSKTQFYKKLISDKGKERVEEREIFLDYES